MNRRNVGIDLLRIVSMYMIVVLHVLGRGEVLLNVPYLSGKYALAWTLEIAMYCAVNCYAIITGYVYYGTERKWENIVNLWMQTFFYSAGIAVLFFLFNKAQGVSMKEIVKLFVPLSSNRYWYFSAYVGVFLFIPLLNYIVDKCEQKILLRNLIIITVGLSFPTLAFYSDPFALNYGYSTLWLMILYLIGAYYRKYDAIPKKKKVYLMWYLGCVLGTSIAKYLVAYISKMCGINLPGSFLVTNITPTVLVSAICLFQIFRSIQIKRERVRKNIVCFGMLSYGVFLIHVHPLVAKTYLDGKFAWIAEKPGWLMIILIFFVAALIYIFCLPIEVMRMLVFKICKMSYCSKLIVVNARKVLSKKVILRTNQEDSKKWRS